LPTPDELRAAIATSQDAFRSALSSAGATWDSAPAAGGEGEAAWSPRQVAEHAIPADVYFASKLCEACGYPGVTWEGAKEFATAAEAADAFEQAIKISNGRLKYVTDTDLPKAKEGSDRTAQFWMELAAHHLDDHAKQIASTNA
jgi:hypothetical protein